MKRVSTLFGAKALLMAFVVFLGTLIGGCVKQADYPYVPVSGGGELAPATYSMSIFVYDYEDGAAMEATVTAPGLTFASNAGCYTATVEGNKDYTVTATKAGYENSTVGVYVPQGKAGETIQVTAAIWMSKTAEAPAVVLTKYTINGLAVTADGIVAAADLTATLVEENATANGNPFQFVLTETTEDQYAGTYNLVLTATGYHDAYALVALPNFSSEEIEVAVNVPMVPIQEPRVIVFDGYVLSAGTPVEGATVTGAWGEDNVAFSLTTDANGYFFIPDYTGGAVSALITKEGFAPSRFSTPGKTTAFIFLTVATPGVVEEGAVTSESEAVVIALEDAANAPIASIELPAGLFETPTIVTVVANNAVAPVDEAGEAVTHPAEATEAQVLSLTFDADGAAFAEGKTVTVTIPNPYGAGVDPVLYYEGAVETQGTVVADAENIVATLTHFSTYTIALRFVKSEKDVTIYNKILAINYDNLEAHVHSHANSEIANPVVDGAVLQNGSGLPIEITGLVVDRYYSGARYFMIFAEGTTDANKEIMMELTGAQDFGQEGFETDYLVEVAPTVLSSGYTTHITASETFKELSLKISDSMSFKVVSVKTHDYVIAEPTAMTSHHHHALHGTIVGAGGGTGGNF